MRNLVLAIFLILAIPTHGADLCNVGGDQRVFAMLLDFSDELTDNQERALRIKVTEFIKQHVKQNDRLIISSLSSYTDNQKQLKALNLCAPINPSETSELGLVDNRALAEKNFKNKVLLPLDAFFYYYLDSKNRPTRQFSPIVEGISALALEAKRYRTLDDNNPAELNLIVFSDLLENTPRFSMYEKSYADYKSFRSSSHFEVIKPDLRGFNVSYYWIPRQSHKQLQDVRLLEFWHELTKSCGGDVVLWDKL
jgi:hypothetical protein